MKVYGILSVIIMLLLIACGQTPPSNDAIKTAIAQTQTFAPTATFFPVEALRPEIEPLLFQDNDLAKNWVGGRFTTKLPDGNPYSELPKPDLVVYQSITNVAYSQEGHVLVTIYRDNTSLENAYKLLFDGNSVNDFAEMAKSLTVGAVGEWHNVAFVRCNAIVYIRIYGLFEEDIIEFAKRVDGRLIKVLCK
jgi:hypothetical protein